jgi:hypothetical protein
MLVVHLLCVCLTNTVPAAGLCDEFCDGVQGVAAA